MLAQAAVIELSLMGGLRTVRIRCEKKAVPAPGRYVLAHASGSDAPLATELFPAAYHEDGFMAAPAVPRDWVPGTVLDLRGPLGKGFQVPAGAKRIALVAFHGNPARLLPLADLAVQQGAAAAVVCETPPLDLPLQLEVHPLGALLEVCGWSDYVAIDVSRDSIPELRGALMLNGQLKVGKWGQALVRVPMPCGGLADCGVCTVRTATGPKLACVDGPVFDLGLLLRER